MIQKSIGAADTTFRIFKIMKLRIQGNSLRLRLTQPEVHRIGQHKAVRETMHMGESNPSFAYVLTTHADDRPLRVTYQENEIGVSLPAAIAQQWAASEQVGIEEQLALEDEQTLHVLIEKDFQCLHRDEAEEPHQFPNPAANQPT